MKPETEIRNLKREVKDLKYDRDRFQTNCRLQENAAKEALREVQEWKERFDKLLERQGLPPEFAKIGTQM